MLRDLLARLGQCLLPGVPRQTSRHVGEQSLCGQPQLEEFAVLGRDCRAQLLEFRASPPDQFSFLVATLPLPLELSRGAPVAVAKAAPGGAQASGQPEPPRFKGSLACSQTRFGFDEIDFPGRELLGC